MIPLLILTPAFVQRAMGLSAKPATAGKTAAETPPPPVPAECVAPPVRLMGNES